MSEYIKKDDLLVKAVEVEYLGRPRMMVSVAKIGQQPSIDIVRCSECIHNPWNVDSDYTCIWDDDFANREQTPDDFCSYGERAEQTEPQTSGVVWTEDAIKDEPKSYSTWASTDEPQTNADQRTQCVESVETMSCQECKYWTYDTRWGWFCPLKGQDECKYKPKEPMTDCSWK